MCNVSRSHEKTRFFCRLAKILYAFRETGIFAHEVYTWPRQEPRCCSVMSGVLFYKSVRGRSCRFPAGRSTWSCDEWKALKYSNCLLWPTGRCNQELLSTSLKSRRRSPLEHRGVPSFRASTCGRWYMLVFLVVPVQHGYYLKVGLSGNWFPTR